MTKEDINKIMLSKHEKAPDIGPEVACVLRNGGQILLPFNHGDAPINFPSRWALGAIMELLIADAVQIELDRREGDAP